MSKLDPAERAAETIRELRAALGVCVEQIEQMRGMFDDEDGAIENALTDADTAEAMAQSYWQDHGRDAPTR